MSDDLRTPADRLADELRRHREQVGIAGTELARRTGYSQPTVSRWERRVGPPPGMLAVGRVVWHLGLTPAERRELIDLARTVAEQRSTTTPIRIVLQHGVESVQRRIRLRERTVEHLRVYHPTIVPGLLQTESFARLVFSVHGMTGDRLERLVAERTGRARESAERRCTILLPEGCLQQGVADAAAMAEQCDHIAGVAVEHRFWRVGVIPRVTTTGIAANITMNAFDLYDEREVFIGTTAGNALVSDAFTVQEHLRRFAELEEMAIYGEAARQIVGRMAEEYRSYPT